MYIYGTGGCVVPCTQHNRVSILLHTIGQHLSFENCSHNFACTKLHVCICILGKYTFLRYTSVKNAGCVYSDNKIMHKSRVFENLAQYDGSAWNSILKFIFNGLSLSHTGFWNKGEFHPNTADAVRYRTVLIKDQKHLPITYRNIATKKLKSYTMRFTMNVCLYPWFRCPRVSLSSSIEETEYGIFHLPEREGEFGEYGDSQLEILNKG